MVTIIKDKSIFDSPAQTLVNAVNCFGVMGGGIALEFRKRHPEMYLKYSEICRNGLMKPGKLWLYKEGDDEWILNFPTKNHWRNSSKIEYIEDGLKKFVSTWKEKGITSIAFPLLGCGLGGLKRDDVLQIMLKYLDSPECEGLEVEIYDHDKTY